MNIDQKQILYYIKLRIKPVWFKKEIVEMIMGIDCENRMDWALNETFF